MDRSFNAVAMTFGIIAFMALLWTDFKRTDLVQVSNAINQICTIERSSREQPFLKMARKLVIDLPQWPTPEYTYTPIFSWIFAPMQAAHPSWSPFLWQLLSMIAFVVSIYAIVRTHEEPEERNMRSVVLSFVALAFLPVLMSLDLGGADIVFGVLPLSLGYYFLTTKCPIKAGLILSLTLLKPQFLLPALFLAATMIVDKKRQKGLISMIAALAFIFAFDALLLGGTVSKELVHCFQLSDATSFYHGIAPQLNMSFSGSITPLVSQTQFEVLKPAIYAFGVFWGSLAFIAATRLWQVRITEEKKLGITFILAIFITPFIVPNFFLHNFAIYVPAGIVALCAKWSHEGYWEFKAVLRMTWLLVNIFAAPFFLGKVITAPIILIFFLLIFYRRLLIIAEAIRTKESIPEVALVDR
jgi:hypothetical protein